MLRGLQTINGPQNLSHINANGSWVVEDQSKMPLRTDDKDGTGFERQSLGDSIASFDVLHVVIIQTIGS